MRPKDIKVGKTYRNRGAGRTTRTVIDIGTHVRHPWYGKNSGKTSVLFTQTRIGKKTEFNLSLESFAQWAGGEVEDTV